MGKQIITIDEDKCTGCGACVNNCAQSALKIVDGKARLVGESLCDGMGMCIGSCPQGAITFQEKEEEALPCGCPGTMARDFRSAGAPAVEESARAVSSRLRQWPVQLALVNSRAPYFKDADLLDRRIPARAIQSTMTPSGIRITLDKSSTRDQNTLVENILCLFDVVQPARYIIASRGRVYMVPPYFAKNLELATRFLKHWRKHAGSAKLLSARSKEGQILLLREREAHLLNRIPQPVSRHRRWS